MNRTPAPHLAALKNGKTLALDVRDEYVAFLKANAAKKAPSKRKTGGRDDG